MDGGNETEAANLSPLVQELENLHACRLLLTRCIVGEPREGLLRARFINLHRLKKKDRLIHYGVRHQRCSA